MFVHLAAGDPVPRPTSDVRLRPVRHAADRGTCAQRRPGLHLVSRPRTTPPVMSRESQGLGRDRAIFQFTSFLPVIFILYYIQLKIEKSR